MESVIFYLEELLNHLDVCISDRSSSIDTFFSELDFPEKFPKHLPGDIVSIFVF